MLKSNDGKNKNYATIVKDIEKTERLNPLSIDRSEK